MNRIYNEEEGTTENKKKIVEKELYKKKELTRSSQDLIGIPYTKS